MIATTDTERCPNCGYVTTGTWVLVDSSSPTAISQFENFSRVSVCYISDTDIDDLLNDEPVPEGPYFDKKFVRRDRVFQSQVLDGFYFRPKRKMKAKGIFKKGRCHG